ncbi:MAG: hypothetical protein AB8C40_10490 [Gammaproteobacteria bacterium]
MNKTIKFILSILLELLSLFQYTYVAVCTHRIVILGSSSVPEWGLRKYSSREGIFFFYSLLLMILSVLVLSTSQFSQNFWVMIIPWIFIAYISIRFSLIFPACAIDQHISLKQSWEYTKNKFVFMVMATLIWPILFAIPIVLVMFGITLIGGTIIPLIGMFAGSLFGVLLAIALIASLSLAYVRIVDNNKAETTSQ